MTSWRTSQVLCLSQEDELKVAPGHIHALGCLRAPQDEQEGEELEDVLLVGAEKNDSWCFVPWVYRKNSGLGIWQIFTGGTTIPLPLLKSLNMAFSVYHLPERVFMRIKWGEVTQHVVQAWHGVKENKNHPSSEPCSGNQKQSMGGGREGRTQNVAVKRDHF